MQLHISSNDGQPIYRQIVQQIKLLLASGRLAPGDELHAIRKLAEELVINPNTVARAYRELEAAGLLESRQGSGTRVTANGSPLSQREKTRLLTQRIDALIAEAKHLGIDYEDVLVILRSRHNRLDSNQSGRKRK
jgi:GntR family transcriptional regulator